MIRRIVGSIAVISLLAGCGGAGGSGGSMTPSLTSKTPAQAVAATATFKLELPGKATMTKLHRNYQSQGTQGVAIDWTSTNPIHPDYAAPITAVCPATLPAGVTACSIDPSGSTDYAFVLTIPIGSYPHFTVSTFNAPPSGTSGTAAFTGASLLAQGQLAAPVVISSNQSNTIPNLTFFGVPAAVSFVPDDAQSHVENFSANNVNGYAIIGNQLQTFFAQATDAAGYFIGSTDGGGAPTITVAESTSDPEQYLHVATTANANQFTLQAVLAPVSASTTPMINVIATAGGTGLPAIANAFAITPVQELFTTQSSGEGQSGVVGYPLFPPMYTPSAILDLANPLFAEGAPPIWEYAAMAPNGAIWAVALGPSGVYELTQGPASEGLVAPGSASGIPLGEDPQSVAIDAQGLFYLEDSAADTVTVFNTASTASPSTALTSFMPTVNPNSIAIAPSTSAIPSSLRGSIWIGGPGPGLLVYAPYNGGHNPPTLIGTPTNAPTTGQGIAIDPTGHVWISDGATMHVFTIAPSSSTAGITLTPVASTALGTSDGGAQIGVTAQGTGWMGGPASLNGIDPYTLSGSTLTLGQTFTGTALAVPSVFSAIVVP